MLREIVTSKNSDIINTIEIPEVRVQLRRDHIVHVTYRKGTILDVELQMKILNINNKITGGKKSYFIYDAEEGVTVTKEARDNAIKIEHLTPTQASAIVANNLAYRMIANFYIKFNKPKTELKVVNTFEKGIEWIKTLPPLHT